MSRTILNRLGFQLIEVIMASGITAAIVGVIIAIGITSSRGINRTADALLCISLAQHIMELTLSKSFDQIVNDNAIYSTYKDSGNNISAGILFENFEQSTASSMAIDKDFDKILFEQFKALDIRYRIQVIEFDNSLNNDFKQVLVSVFWHNGSGQLNYNLTGNIARKFE